MSKFTIKDLTLAALIAAVYAVLTVALPVPAFSGVQFRVAEAMTVLPLPVPGRHTGAVRGLRHRQSVFPLSPGCGVRLRRHPHRLPAHPADAKPVAGLPSPSGVQHGYRGGGDRPGSRPASARVLEQPTPSTPSP